MPYIGNKPLAKYATLTRQTFSSPTGTSHTLSQTVTNSDDLLLYINNVKQNPADYTASGTTLTTASLAGGTEMYCLYYGKTTETVAVPASSVGDSHIVDMAASKLTGTVSDTQIAGMAASKLTGALPAISGASLTGLPESGDKRNFIIDGDFTQWPTGTSATNVGAGTYVSALVQGYVANTSGTMTIERSTDVPTVAQSGHQSAYSHLAKCTGADTSLGIDDLALHRYHITGNDFAHLHQQQVTVSFWAKTASANSGHTYALTFHNSAFNRSYVHEFTPTSSWTQFTHTLTLDTSGTWLFTEADKGLVVGISLVGTSDYDDATNNTWQGTNEFSAGNVDNFYDSTSNEFYMSQFGLYLGSSAPNFTSLPISTVVDQIKYYVEKHGGNLSGGGERLCTGHAISTTVADFPLYYARKRVAPTTTYGGSASDYDANDNAGKTVSAIAIQAASTSITSSFIRVTTGGTLTVNGALNLGTSNANQFLFFDARH